MIRVKPKGRALISIGVFILACFSLGIYNFMSIIDGDPWWMNFLLAGLFIPLGLVLFIRQLASYKLLTFGNNEIILRHPFIGQSSKVGLKDISSWKETSINTPGGKYNQLNIIAGGLNIRISQQEHTNYGKAMSYLQKRAKQSRAK